MLFNITWIYYALAHWQRDIGLHCNLKMTLTLTFNFLNVGCNFSFWKHPPK